MAKYFKDINTLEELRKQYKELLKRFHPDNPNGSTEATQEINTEYDKLFQTLKDKHDSKTADSQDSRSYYEDMKWDYEEDEKLREKLYKIIGFKNITILIIGNWIWCFNCYEYRKELKDLGFIYAGKKKAWHYHTEAFRKRSNKTLSVREMANYYGCTEVETVGKKLLKQA